MIKWEYYREPFDTNDPPPAPPNRTGVMGWLSGWCETKDSKQEGEEWKARMDEYGCGIRGQG